MKHTTHTPTPVAARATHSHLCILGRARHLLHALYAQHALTGMLRPSDVRFVIVGDGGASPPQIDALALDCPPLALACPGITVTLVDARWLERSVGDARCEPVTPLEFLHGVPDAVAYAQGPRVLVIDAESMFAGHFAGDFGDLGIGWINPSVPVGVTSMLRALVGNHAEQLRAAALDGAALGSPRTVWATVNHGVPASDMLVGDPTTALEVVALERVASLSACDAILGAEPMLARLAADPAEGTINVVMRGFGSALCTRIYAEARAPVPFVSPTRVPRPTEAMRALVAAAGKSMRALRAMWDDAFAREGQNFVVLHGERATQLLTSVVAPPPDAISWAGDVTVLFMPTAILDAVTLSPVDPVACALAADFAACDPGGGAPGDVRVAVWEGDESFVGYVGADFGEALPGADVARFGGPALASRVLEAAFDANAGGIVAMALRDTKPPIEAHEMAIVVTLLTEAGGRELTEADLRRMVEESSEGDPDAELSVEMMVQVTRRNQLLGIGGSMLPVVREAAAAPYDGAIPVVFQAAGFVYVDAFRVAESGGH